LLDARVLFSDLETVVGGIEQMERRILAQFLNVGFEQRICNAEPRPSPASP